MTAEVIDGRGIAATALAELKGEGATLAVVSVGHDPAAASYIRQIRRTFESAGAGVRLVGLPGDVKEPALLDLLEELGRDRAVHGVLLQTPLPSHLEWRRIAQGIPLAKDVDGAHPTSSGLLLANSPEAFAPATPAGGIELLERLGVSPRGKRAVVVGRGPSVGRPMAVMLLHRDATVTVCHSRTERLDEVVREAEILVAAVGRPGMILGDWIRPGAVVIDFGVNAVDGQLRGDVDFESAVEVAGAITPVPGGAGPMTAVMLLRNVLKAARLLR